MAEALRLETLATYFVYPTCDKLDYRLPGSSFVSDNNNKTSNLWSNSNSSRIRANTVARSSLLDNSDTSYDVVMNLVIRLVLNIEFQKWIFSLIGCLLVGIAGIFPFFIFRPPKQKLNCDDKIQNNTLPGIDPKLLNCLLSFAVGSLLGDTFLHLLPEAWERFREDGGDAEESLIRLGSWTLVGIISFIICEKLVSVDGDDSSEISNNNHLGVKKEGPSQTDITAGYFNLLANVFDNFTHGLAVAGSFIVSPKVGFLTTAAILLHEIPHEIADFAILLRSGFNAWSAAKAQLSTASVGLFGAVMALTADSMETQIGNYTWWILPFTAGCFITISLNNLLPDLMKEENTKESLKQFLCLILGIGVMGGMSLLHV